MTLAIRDFHFLEAALHAPQVRLRALRAKHRSFGRMAKLDAARELDLRVAALAHCLYSRPRELSVEKYSAPGEEVGAVMETEV
jgi:hypothetical protein